MTLQNRVDPQGQLHAVPAHGDLMGNRGILHNAQQLIVAQWRSKAWITCQLQFKDRQSPVFAPDSYSQLLFRDDGYQRSTIALPAAARVQVLTPPSVVRVFASGLLPQVHLSAYH